jgi:hypothetical protein
LKAPDLRFDGMWRGKRYRMAANEFAIPRMEPGKQRPIQSMEEARDWERLFIGEIKGGRDPNRIPVRFVQAGAQVGDVAAFLDAYWERCVKPAGLKSLGSVRSQVSVLKQHLGHLTLSALEEPDEINRSRPSPIGRRTSSSPRSIGRWNDYALPSTGDSRKRRRSSPDRRSTGSAFD